MLHELPDSPETVWIMTTGYPSYMQHPIVCERCNDELDPDEVYEDENYEHLCKWCLCRLHKKAGE